ncbi:MAG: suppressor of fused domain protein [Bacteroidetes bacterium]|nr:suppressor of fused domain protein [Bacteroidota bacterium]
MGEVYEVLVKRLGNPEKIEFNGEELLLFKSKEQPLSSILMTYGLSDSAMNAHKKHLDEVHKELYFMLPSYWEVKELDNPKFNWVFHWLIHLKKYVLANNTWFGHGHTMPCGKDMKALSETMLQNHFILSRPIALSNDLAPIQLNNREVGFLAIIPIFGDEMDYKQGKGTVKFFHKFQSAKITEKLDDFRKTSLRAKWRFFG